MRHLNKARRFNKNNLDFMLIDISQGQTKR